MALVTKAPALIYTTREVRRDLKILAALSGVSMMDVLARLVREELKRLRVKS
jgi:hypothetical protein